MSDPYSQTKALWHLDRVADLRTRRVAVPVHLQLVLSDLCNQDCHFCAYRMSGGLSTELFGTAETRNPNRRMPTKIALDLLRDFAGYGGKAVQFTGGGEPTVHADFYRVVAFAQELGLRTALVTNAARLDAARSEVARFDWVRVSVDAGTAATYGGTRGVDAAVWPRMWETVGAVAKLGPRLGVGFVVTNENHAEAAQCVRLCAMAGVAYMRLGAVFSAEGLGYYRDLRAIRASLQAARETAVAAGLELADLFERRAGDLEAGSPTDPWCAYQYFTAYVGADLGVYRCCNTAYTTAGKVWDLRHGSYADFIAQLAPDGFDARGCRFCQFRGQNDAIRAVVTRPDDVDFV